MTTRPKPTPEGSPVEQLEAIGGEAAANAPGQCPVRAGAEVIAPLGAASKPPGAIRAGKLAGLSMWQAIFVLSWPVLAESYLNSFVGLMDTVLAASIDVAATDAIGGAAYIVWFLNIVGMSIGVGATAMIARSVGAGRMAVANAVVGQTTLLAVAAGLLVGALLALAAPLLSAVVIHIDAAADAAQVAQLRAARGYMTDYMRICAIGVPAVAFFTAAIACQRGAGDNNRPLVTMALVNVVNILASWWCSGVEIQFGESFVLRNPSPLDWGIHGIALGTLAAWFVGMGLSLYWLIGGFSGVRLRAKRLVPHWRTMMRVIRVSVPNFLESFGMWFGNFLVIMVVGWLAAPSLLGAHIIAIRAEAFSFLPGFAMGMAAATLVGQYLGAKRPDLARIAVNRCALIGASIMGLMGLLFILAPRAVVSAISDQPVHLETAPELIRLAGYMQIPFGLMLVWRSAIRGAGDTKMAMLITWVSTYAVRLPLAWLFTGVDIPLWGEMRIPNPGPDWGLRGLWIALVFEIGVRAVFFGARYVQGGWSKLRV